MGITLAKIASNVATTSFSYEGETITLAYYPGHVTENVVAALQSFETMTSATIVDGMKKYNEMLAHLLKEWDVYEDDAQTIMFPIDATRFPELPLPFRVAVVSAIMNDIRPEQLATTQS